MKASRCYLAVDGGNTKTEYRLLDERGAVVASYRGGGTNHENLPGGFEDAAKLLCEGALVLLAERGCSLACVADAVLGLAGADYEPQVEALSACLRAAGLKRFLVCNDGYLGVMAGSEDGVGVCLSAGTGVTCAGIAPDGRRVQIGGLGVLSGDIGGGYDIAAFVFRAIYRQLFLNKSPTSLRDAFFTLFDVHTREEFLASAARLVDDEAAQKLIGLYFAAVETGDSIALCHAARCAGYAADCIISAADALSLPAPVRCSFSGTILAKVAPPSYRHMIEYELRRRRGDAFRTQVNDRPPVDGAARWVRLRNNLPAGA